MRLKIIKQKGGKMIEGGIQIKNIPDKLTDELNHFIKRNSLVFLHLPNTANGICKRCLKAHAIRKAQEMNLHKWIICSISEKFDCEAGHNGYYLDKSKLIKI